MITQELLASLAVFDLSRVRQAWVNTRAAAGLLALAPADALFARADARRRS